MSALITSDQTVLTSDERVLRGAVAPYLGRYRGQSRLGVSLRDVQIAARHTDPRTTMRYDRARRSLDRHPNYILAAYMASGT